MFKKISKWLNKYSTLVGVLSNFVVLVVSVVYMQLQINEAKKQAQDSAVVNAWQLLTTPAPGNSGKKEALETLAKAGKNLDGIDLSSERNGGAVWLEGLKLENANLMTVNFSGAFLYNADFSDANLLGAKFHNNQIMYGSYFANANLSRTEFVNSNLQSVHFEYAKNFDKAIFKNCYTPYENYDYYYHPSTPECWEFEYVRDKYGNPKKYYNKNNKHLGYYINAVRTECTNKGSEYYNNWPVSKPNN